MTVRAELRGVLTGVSLLAVGLLAAISGPTLIPGQELLGSLRFHIGLALLVLPLLLLMAAAWWRGVLMLLLIALSLTEGGLTIWRQQSARPALEARTTAAVVDVLSFNVLAMNERGADIVDYALHTAPDLFVTMESNAILGQLTELSVDYPYRAGCDQRGGNCDLMIFSRTPLEQVAVRGLAPFGRLRLITARTVVEGQAFTIVGIHLSKPYFDEASWEELEQLHRTLRDIEGPIIVTGDFNATAWSRAVARMVATSDLVPPPAYPATWPIRLGVVGLPIDNMFTRGNAVIEAIAAVEDNFGSNHRGLLARIRIVTAD